MADRQGDRHKLIPSSFRLDQEDKARLKEIRKHYGITTANDAIRQLINKTYLEIQKERIEQ